MEEGTTDEVGQHIVPKIDPINKLEVEKWRQPWVKKCGNG